MYTSAVLDAVYMKIFSHDAFSQVMLCDRAVQAVYEDEDQYEYRILYEIAEDDEIIATMDFGCPIMTSRYQGAAEYLMFANAVLYQPTGVQFVFKPSVNRIFACIRFGEPGDCVKAAMILDAACRSFSEDITSFAAGLLPDNLVRMRVADTAQQGVMELRFDCDEEPDDDDYRDDDDPVWADDRREDDDRWEDDDMFFDDECDDEEDIDYCAGSEFAPYTEPGAEDIGDPDDEEFDDGA